MQLKASAPELQGVVERLAPHGGALRPDVLELALEGDRRLGLEPRFAQLLVPPSGDAVATGGRVAAAGHSEESDRRNLDRPLG